MKGFFQAPWRFAACYAAFLIAAFTWALLDTFVIPHRELIVSRARDVADEVLETLAPSATLAAPQAADASFYQDESMRCSSPLSGATAPPAMWRTCGWRAPPFCARPWPKTPSAAT